MKICIKNLFSDNFEQFFCKKKFIKWYRPADHDIKTDVRQQEIKELL